MTIQSPYLFIEAQSYYTIAQLALSLQYFYFGLLSAGTLGCTTVPSLLPTVFLSALKHCYTKKPYQNLPNSSTLKWGVTTTSYASFRN